MRCGIVTLIRFPFHIFERQRSPDLIQSHLGVSLNLLEPRFIPKPFLELLETLGTLRTVFVIGGLRAFLGLNILEETGGDKGEIVRK